MGEECEINDEEYPSCCELNEKQNQTLCHIEEIGFNVFILLKKYFEIKFEKNDKENKDIQSEITSFREMLGEIFKVQVKPETSLIRIVR
jgi:hypothetical protein